MIAEFIDKLTKDPSLEPKISLLYAQMQEVRKRLLRIIEPIDDNMIDFSPNEKEFETIGTMLYHIAGVEWSWIFQDIDGEELDEEKWKYAFPLRKEVNIPQLKGQGKKFYLIELESVRKKVFERLKKFSDNDLEKLYGTETEKFSLEWVLFHLIEHETIHIGQIQILIRLFKDIHKI
ncbi:MAG: DinB family protein [Candidatus Thorarchaeota archaeon]